MYPRDERHLITKLLSETTALLEIVATLTMRSRLARQMPEGDGHSVVLVPGFTASDRAMGQMRRFLNECGYNAQGWGQGRNTGLNQDGIDTLVDTVESLATESGGKVSIIGWSGGGMYARAIATLAPDTVRQVITLGTPFKMTEETLHYIPEGIHKLHERLSPEADEFEEDITNTWNETPPVPSTSIYSERDALAPWPFCLDHMDDQSENIHVSCSHAGMPFNPFIYFIIADRLSQTDWNHFEIHQLGRAIFRHACASDFITS